MGEFVTLRFPRSTTETVPRASMKLAHDRTEYLLARVKYHSIVDLMAFAYLQGINDAAQTAEIQDKIPLEKTAPEKE